MREGEPHLEEEPQNTEPFIAGETIKKGEFSIRESADNPNKVIRTESMVGSLDETIDHYKNIKGYFELMRDNYGIKIPDFNVVIGESQKGNQNVFMIVDRINGRNLGESEKLPEETKEKFETFYTSLLQSIFDGYQKGEPFYCDFKAGNIMYGHKSKDQTAEDDFFLADVGGGFQEGNQVEFHGQLIPVDYNQGFFRALINAKIDLQDYEKKFGENTKLSGIKTKLEEIFEYCKNNKKLELEDFFAKDPTAKVDFLGEDKPIESNPKQETWDRVLQDLDDVGDKLGRPIDKDIRETVASFMVNGYPTSGSCEGHLEKRFNETIKLSPYVAIGQSEPEIRFIGEKEIRQNIAENLGISVEDLDEDKQATKKYWEYIVKNKVQETPDFLAIRKHNQIIQKEVEAFLDEFYSDRKIEGRKITMRNVGPAGEFYVTTAAKMEDTGNKIEEEDMEKAQQELEQEQREFADFTEFMRKKYFTKAN